MSTSRDTHERRQAVWPWILMPIIVLVVFYTLQRFQDSARIATAVPQTHSANHSDDTVQP
jgi:hypothetical protein